MKTFWLFLAPVAAVSVLGTAAQATVVIDTVTVGNAGNAGDTRYPSGGVSSFGSVGYTFNMGKYEVTAGQYTAFLNAVAATDTHGLYNTNMGSISSSWRGCNIQRSGSPGSYTYSVAPDWANRPVNYVYWGDAARFANWMHNGQPTGPQGLPTTERGSYRLYLHPVTREADATWVIPSEDELYKAAYHKNDGVTGNYFDYPTSSDTTPSNDLIDPDPGNNANFYQDGYTIAYPYYRTEVGDFENSESPYGTFDQGGNVSEWNEAILIGSYRVLRGGSFNTTESTLHAASRDIGDYLPDEHYSIGFRVAWVPEPASAVLLLVGGLAVIARRRATRSARPVACSRGSVR